jgi:RNase adapter protein RapZ
MHKHKHNTVVIVTGLSGAGKSYAIKCLEDLGYFCIDNLPVMLITKFIDFYLHANKKIEKVAFGVDVREKNFLKDVSQVLSSLKHRNIKYQIIFFEASNDALVRRFSETRRKHPLFKESKTVLNSIKMERMLLSDIRAKATKIIDTTNLSPTDLRELITDFFKEKNESKLIINLVSFGYKYGLPVDADLVFDTRFLANPFYDLKLRMYTGNDKKIRKFVLNNKEGKEFVERLKDFFKFLMPLFLKEGKSYLTIAFGCTGGKHRSVTLVNEMKDFFESLNYDVRVVHRDIIKK